MKKILILSMVLLSVLTAFLLGMGGLQPVLADGSDRVCVMHPQAGVPREKWVEPSDLDAHLRHGDSLCPVDLLPPPTAPAPEPDTRIKMFLPVAVFGYIPCEWCK